MKKRGEIIRCDQCFCVIEGRDRRRCMACINGGFDVIRPLFWTDAVANAQESNGRARKRA